MAVTVKPLSILRVDAAARRKLLFYSKVGLEGRAVDYRTTCFSVKNTSKVPVDSGARIPGVEGVKPIARQFIIDSFVPNILEDVKKFPTITKFEKEFIQYTKSSRSIQKPWKDRKQKLIESFKNQETTLEITKLPNYESLLKRAAAKLEAEIRVKIPESSIRPYSFERSCETMEKPTDWGAPYWLKGHEVDREGKLIDNTGKYLEVAYKIRDCLMAHKPVPLEYKVFRALSRIQEGKDGDSKNRIVWGEAHGCTILGGISRPLLEAFRRLPTRKILIGLDEVNEQLKTVVRSNKSTILSADQSGFDNHIRAEFCIKYIVPIIMRSIHFPSDRPDYRVCLEWYLTEHMWNDPIVTPEGVYFGLHGMPSGVLWVNEMDSLYLQFVNHLFNEIAGMRVFETIAVQGDDIVMYVYNIPEGRVALEYERYCHLVGLEANELKQWVSTNSLTFVRRLWTTETENGYRSKIWSLVGELNMERGKPWREYMYEARGGSILCNHYLTDPGISQFFWQITLGYQYLLGLDLKNGYYNILQRAGGVDEVSRRLDLAHYANHLGTEPLKGRDAWRLDVSELTIMKWQRKVREENLTKPTSWVWSRIS